MSATSGASVAVLVDLLSREHAAVWAYGVVGAQLSGAPLELAREGDRLHRQRRDALKARILTAGGDPAPPLPAYTLPFPVTDTASAARLAAAVEDDLAGAYADGVAKTSSGDIRRGAVSALRESAIRAARWRLIGGITPVTVALPGS